MCSLNLNLDYINPFLISGVGVLNDLLGEKPVRSEVKIQTTSFKSEGIAAIVGITKGRIIEEAGQLGKGRILIDMQKETAIKIAEAIYEEKYDDVTNEVFESISEIVNMISGGGITSINNKFKGTNLRLSYPSIFSGKNLEIDSPKLKSVSVKFKLSMGELSLNIAFEGIEG